MSHQANWKEYADAGQGKAHGDATCKYDATYGEYKVNTTMKPTAAKAQLPAEPKPFTLKG